MIDNTETWRRIKDSQSRIEMLEDDYRKPVAATLYTLYFVACCLIVALLGFLVLFVGGCTTQEKAVVRTVVDIARAVCTPQDTLDACVDKILSDRQVKAARLARTRE